MALLYLWMMHHGYLDEASDASETDRSDSQDTVADNSFQNVVNVTNFTANRDLHDGTDNFVGVCDLVSNDNMNKNRSYRNAYDQENRTNASYLFDVPDSINCDSKSVKHHGQKSAMQFEPQPNSTFSELDFDTNRKSRKDDGMKQEVAVDQNENLVLAGEKEVRNICTDQLEERLKQKNEKKNANTEFLPCLICQITFNNKSEVMRHMTKIHRLTNLCQICYFDDGKMKRFANPVSLRNHKVRDHPEDMVKCICGAMLIDNKMLMSHLRKFKCNIFKSGTGASEMVKCICGKRFGSQQLLLKHRFKCRKRHCLHDDIFKECMMDTKRPSTKGLERIAVDNMKPFETKTACNLVTLTDMNNNIVGSEDFDMSLGRASRLRKCKENVGSYSEKVYDKIFENAVNPVLDLSCSKRSRRKSHDHFPAVYETRSVGQSLTETVGSVSADILDLRTKSVLERDKTEANNKCKPEADSSKVTDSCIMAVDKVGKTDEKQSMHTGKMHTKKKIENVVEKLRQAIKAKKELPGLEPKEPEMETKVHVIGTIKRKSTALPNLEKTKTLSKQRKKTQARKKKADKDGRYPCSKCRKRYKRPYLYVHQKYAHAPKKWIWVPVATLRNKPEGRVLYRCGWCRFVTLHWTLGVRHHYSLHQQLELDLIRIVAVTKDCTAGKKSSLCLMYPGTVQ